MKKNRPNIDDFVLRRRDQNSDMSRQLRTSINDVRRTVPDRYLIDPTTKKNDHPGKPGAPSLRRTSGPAGIGVDNSLKLPKPGRDALDLNMDLGDQPEPPKKKLGGRFKISRKKLIKRIAIVLAVIVLAVAAFLVYKFVLTSGKIFGGDVISALFNDGQPLKEDKNGRSNVLIFGTSEDDPGHEAADLTDSMMIASVNQTTKDAFLVSIPRDLYIDYGRACPAGFRGKINAYFSCVKEAEGEKAARAALRTKVGEVFGLNIQYNAQLNYTALRKAVDAVGGITVVIDSDDPRGILDRNFDWDCPNGLFTCYNVKYPNGPAHLNGKQALYLARARGANGITYGLPQANFDREKYQRAILIALRDKAVSAGTLANPLAVSNLLDALGDNVRTNFVAEEIKTLVRLGREIEQDKIRSLVLNDPEKPLVTTGNVDGQSAVIPAAGQYVYTGIQAAIDAYSTGDLAVIEGAVIDVLNASEKVGAAQEKADELAGKKLTIGVVSNAPLSLGPKPVSLYNLSGKENPSTKEKLESLLGVKSSNKVPAGIVSDADFVVVIGKPAKTQ